MIMSLDRNYLVWAISYAVIGMGLGIFVAASNNHAQHVTHAHILLVGFVVSLSCAVIHKLWLGDKTPRVAKTQFIVHQADAVTMFSGLLLLYGNMVPETQLDPILAIASIAVFTAALLMLFMVMKSNSVKR